ncbi:MAG: glycosyltransferase family 2 protein [Chthoniobacter sp.]|uniref:glycosyltransferase family 2 protein n=1 Tax=Chthoniobacter sp. TaxID=2510640 RepID=UPI0032ABDC76
MRFSIITPSFRNAEWLKLCIASVADQQGVEVEHIVQDAGSDDGTQEWLPKDSRVRAFIEKDEGMYDAINRGLRRASGDILAYLNCDEQYLPGALARVRDFFAAHPEIDVLFGDAILVDQHGAPLSYRRMVLPLRAHVRIVHLNTLTCATFFRRSVIERGHFFDLQWKVIGDGAWTDDLLRARVSMATLPEPLAAFAFTGANLGASARGAEEMKVLRGAAWKSALAPLLSLHHRWRKWKAGAYAPHAVLYALYTKESPGQRVAFSESRLGFDWPHQLATGATGS